MKKFLIALVVLSGCYSPKIANRYLDGLYRKNPALLNAKMEAYHRCNWIIIKMTPAEQRETDSIFNLKN